MNHTQFAPAYLHNSTPSTRCMMPMCMMPCCACMKRERTRSWLIQDLRQPLA